MKFRTLPARGMIARCTWGGTLIVIIALAGCGSESVETEGEPALTWASFTSPPGKFRVEMPGETEMNRIELETDEGLSTMFQFFVELEGARVVLLYSDYPQEVLEVKTSDEVLRDGREGALQASGGELIEAGRWELEGHPGREWVIGTATGRAIRSRLLLAGERLYQLMVITEAASPFDGEGLAERFWSSFELIGGEARD